MFQEPAKRWKTKECMFPGSGIFCMAANSEVERDGDCENAIFQREVIFSTLNCI